MLTPHHENLLQILREVQDRPAVKCNLAGGSGYGPLVFALSAVGATDQDERSFCRTVLQCLRDLTQSLEQRLLQNNPGAIPSWATKQKENKALQELTLKERVQAHQTRLFLASEAAWQAVYPDRRPFREIGIEAQAEWMRVADLLMCTDAVASASQPVLLRCVVAGSNANGEPDLHFVFVLCTREQQNNGAHYEAAKRQAEQDGYEPKVVYDEDDSAGEAMMSLFEWRTASVVDIYTTQLPEAHAAQCRPVE